MNGGRLRKLILVGILVASFVAPFTVSHKASATTLDDLLKQQEALRAEANKNKQAANQASGKISDLQGAINSIDTSISSTQAKIDNTSQQISVTNQVITDISSTISQTQDQLNQLNTKLRNAYVGLYELSRTDGVLSIQSQSLDEAVTTAQYVQSIQTQLQSNIQQMNTLMTDLNNKKADNEKQKASLENLKQQLSGDKASLASQRNQKDYLLQATSDQLNGYLTNYDQIQKRISEIQRQINILISQNSWGSDIISSNDPGWFYSQLDYPNTYLGNSPYTVAQYGCLVTSFAMVATFYGHHVTPADIARIPGLFDSEGYMTQATPPGIGVTTTSAGPVDWATVNNELDNGHPVIISIYLPSVGAINSDGSSHFIVLKGHSGDKYFMHDPLGGGRSYSAQNVRSMKIIRPN